MYRTIAIVIAAACLIVLDSQLATAQWQGVRGYGSSVSSPSGPTLSPYLNLLNNNNRPAVANYHTQVRPLLESRAAAQQQAAAVQQLQRQLNEIQSASQTRTPARRKSLGQTPRFMNLSHYYSGLRR